MLRAKQSFFIDLQKNEVLNMMGNLQLRLRNELTFDRAECGTCVFGNVANKTSWKVQVSIAIIEPSFVRLFGFLTVVVSRADACARDPGCKS